MTKRVPLLACGLALALAAAAAPPQDPTPPESPAPAAVPRLFAVVFRTGPAWDAAKPPREQRHFKDHSENIAALKAEGRLALGGRFADVGLLLVRAASQAEADSLVARDPSVAAGVFKAEVHPWSTFAEGCVQRIR
jgi:uncharacterized protein YciI